MPWLWHSVTICSKLVNMVLPFLYWVPSIQKNASSDQQHISYGHLPFSSQGREGTPDITGDTCSETWVYLRLISPVSNMSSSHLHLHRAVKWPFRNTVIIISAWSVYSLKSDLTASDWGGDSFLVCVWQLSMKSLDTALRYCLLKKSIDKRM